MRDGTQTADALRGDSRRSIPYGGESGGQGASVAPAGPQQLIWSKILREGQAWRIPWRGRRGTPPLRTPDNPRSGEVRGGALTPFLRGS